jgi:glycosyltransferase involved in cell wall biosynthesis
VVGDPQYHSGSEYEWFQTVFKPTIEQFPNIIHINNIPHDELFPVISESAGLIVPCHDESFSLSAFEAQKLGIPVMHIKSKVGSLEEYVIDGKTGILIDSYRKRKPALREEILSKVKDLTSLDRDFIYNHFKSNYSEKKFIDNLLVQLRETMSL